MTQPRTEETTLIRVHKRLQRRRQRSDWRGYPTDGQGQWMHASVTPATPTIIGVAPSTILASAPPTTFTVNGTNFVPSSVVEVSGVLVPTTYVSAVVLRAVFDPSIVTSAQFRVRTGDMVSNAVPVAVTATQEEEDPATNPEKFTIVEIQEWTDLNPDWADEVLAREQARGDAARVTLVDWLMGFIAHRDE